MTELWRSFNNIDCSCGAELVEHDDGVEVRFEGGCWVGHETKVEIDLRNCVVRVINDDSVVLERRMCS